MAVITRMLGSRRFRNFFVRDVKRVFMIEARDMNEGGSFKRISKLSLVWLIQDNLQSLQKLSYIHNLRTISVGEQNT